MAYGYIYLIQHRTSGKVYVGQTVGAPEKRWKSHVAQRGPSAVCVVDRAIHKHGAMAFEFDVLCEANSQPALDDLERVWIWALQAMKPNYGYNVKSGGAKGRHSDESRKRMSVSAKIRCQDPAWADRNRRIGKQKVGKPGQPHSQETKQRLSEYRKQWWQDNQDQRRVVAERTRQAAKRSWEQLTEEQRQARLAPMKAARWARGL